MKAKLSVAILCKQKKKKTNCPKGALFPAKKDFCYHFNLRQFGVYMINYFSAWQLFVKHIFNLFEVLSKVHVQIDALHKLSVKSVDVSVVDIDAIVLVRIYITRFWAKSSYSAVVLQDITRRSAKYCSLFRITAMVDRKRASGARWAAESGEDNLLQDIFDRSVRHKGPTLIKIQMKDFSQLVDCFNFCSWASWGPFIFCVLNS